MTSDLPGRLDVLAERLVEPGPAPVGAIHDRARSRRGRRRRVVGAVAAIVVVISGGAAIAGHATTTKAVANLPAVPPHLVVEGTPCRTTSQFTDTPFPASGHLPTGATTAQLCPLYNEWESPRDLLTTDVEGLIDMINAEPVTPPGRLCLPSHGFTEYSLTFAYPDGTTRAVVGEINGPCGTGLYTSPTRKGARVTTKEGAQVVLSRYVDGLAAQRARQSPPVLDDPPSGACAEYEGGLSDSIVGPRNELDLVTGEVCTYEWAKTGPSTAAYVLQRSAPLTQTQVRRLDQLYRAHAKPVGTDHVDYDVDGPFTTIAGVNSWGETVTLELLKDGLVRNRSLGDPGQDAIWRISGDQLEAVLTD